MDIIEELKAANEEVQKQRALIEQEMEEKGNKGKLWQNGMCLAWPAYERAIDTQAKLRAKHGV
jgi:hypothetical protein